MAAAPTVTLTPVQEVVSLTNDELLLTLTQFVFLLEQVLGLPPDPALVSSLAAFQNAILLNPLAQTLSGQDMGISTEAWRKYAQDMPAPKDR